MTTLAAGNTLQEQAASKKWWIITTIMMVAILEVLDSTIVNVALPTMMPTLGANQEEITWVLTSYVVASAIMLPLTGFLSLRIGQKKLLMINVLGFMASSMMCGLSESLSMMVVFRVLQGSFGAALIPISQAILRESFPLEEQGKAMAIWGMGIMVAPVLGPTLGGYITEYLNWRWIFYINIPFCILGFILISIVIPKAKSTYQKIDWLGVILMVIGVGSLQLFLDQGNTKDWFNSNFILLLCVTGGLALILFILRSLTHSKPVIQLKLFKDRNFALSTIILSVFCACLFGMITLEPIMLESLFGYTTIIAGMTIAPIGMASAFGMMLSSQLMSKVNVKYLLIPSLISCSAGLYYLSSLDLSATQNNIIIANCFIGFGMGLFMVPLATYALATINEKYITEASGLFSYGRMLGTSVGISILSTLVSREAQINWNQLGAHLSRYNNNLHTWLSHSHLNLSQPKTAPLLGHQLMQQANMLSFIDAYIAMSIALLALIPLVFLMKNLSLKSQ